MRRCAKSSARASGPLIALAGLLTSFPGQCEALYDNRWVGDLKLPDGTASGCFHLELVARFNRNAWLDPTGENV